MVKFFASLTLVAVAQLDIPTKEIAPGVHMPMAGLGTWEYNNTVAEAAVKMALVYGTRSIDTASVYDNQEGVGAGVKSSGVPRKEIFLTTKVLPGLGEEGTVANHEDNLKKLGMEYVDLLLTHMSCSFDVEDPQHSPLCNKTDRQATWRGLERIYHAGKARAIGVSHFCQQHMDDVLEIATVPLAVNQQEWHVGMGPDPQGVVSYCDAHGITYQSFMPLCNPKYCNSTELYDGKLVTDIGKAHGKVGPQVALKWLVESGSPVIPKTSNPDHLAEDMDLFSWDLTKAEFERLSSATSPPSVEPVADDCKITLDVTV
jgi:diketogulonate reductase-like aldo/keto reductase